MATTTSPARPESQCLMTSAAPKKRGAPGTTSSASSTLACKKCRARKVKCDAAFPSCSGCTKAGVPCIVADYTTSRDYTRSDVNDLEERLRELEASLGQSGGDAPEPTTRRSRRAVSSSVHHEGQADNGDSPARYVGREAGVDFFQPMLEAIRKESLTSLRRDGMSASQIQASSIVYCEPHVLPAREEALRLTASYLREFHVAHQFLDPSEVASLFAGLWDQVPSPSVSDTKNRRKKELFTANMIMAIGAVGMFRAGLTSSHPFGFFTAALSASPPSELSFGTIEDLESILLIAHFGVFYNIGCSIWELSRLCIRICVELRLYQADAEHNLSTEQVNRHRRVFWEAYSLDRFASVTLGRPFAIDDAIITTEQAQEPYQPPDIDPLHSDLVFINAGWPSLAEASDRRVSAHLLTLSRITSDLHRSQQASGFRSRESNSPNMPRTLTNASHSSYRLLFKLKDDLEQWRNIAPIFDHPRCLYQCPDYFDLCLQKEKLYLIRVAIDRSPVRGALPPQYLLTPCLDTAHNVIRLFDSLRRRNLAACTRSNTHLIFTTSLIILFLTFAQVHPQYGRPEAEARGASRVDVGSWWSGLLEEGKVPTQTESLDVLSMASATLHWLASSMKDMSPYAQFLDILRQELTKEIHKNLSVTTAQNDANSHGISDGNISQPGDQPLSGYAPDTLAQARLNPAFSEVPLEGHNTRDHFEGYDAFPSLSQGQGISPEGFLLDLFPVEDFTQDGMGMQPMLASWPFSQMPWMESFNTDLSGYDADFFHFP